MKGKYQNPLVSGKQNIWLVTKGKYQNHLVSWR